MKQILKQVFRTAYRFIFEEDLLQTIEKSCPAPEIPAETSGEKLYRLAMNHYGTDPTPDDKVDDEISCVYSLTTILKEVVPDFPVMEYTPRFLEQIEKDARFRKTVEFKKGNIIISPTGSGSARITGHTGICGINGKILSNSSATGLWTDKFDQISWIDRYSRMGGLDVHIFELV